ncbi:MAG: hypothetical protein M0Z85_05205 [Gammaproteobacteria bacterium]|jgi:hypothetical protein|nr:hypothetical protein [Gammaproteobacteria bacterium]
MGALYDMGAFFRWLEVASEREILQKRDLLAHAIEYKLTEKSVIADAQYLLKKIEQELLARSML